MAEPSPRHRTAADVVAAIPDTLHPRIVAGVADTPWRGISHDSRLVNAGNLFCCVRGDTVDGHEFAHDVVDAGVQVLLVDHHITTVSSSVTQICVDSVRDAVGYVAADAYDFPSNDVVVIGITGTNGKTSTAHILGGLLDGLGLKTAVFGTLSGERTTPEAIDIQKRLATCRDEGVSHVVMEVSSHALVLGRMHGTHLRAAVFTNLGHDHLDFHKTQEEYFAAKASLFDEKYTEMAIVNRDDPHGLMIVDTTNAHAIGFGEDDLSDICVTARETQFRWQDSEFRIPIGGSFTLMNALAAVTVVKSLGYSPSQIAEACKNVLPVRGRFELVAGAKDFDVVVDYAHTPEGLQEVLTTARDLTDSSLITVFGCGGDRDATKRPLMGRIASEIADTVIITSDNPRSEDPHSIISAIRSGVTSPRGEVITIGDRREAIAAALQRASKGDIVVIAGKGHETTQEIAGVISPFNDVEVTQQILEDQKIVKNKAGDAQ